MRVILFQPRFAALVESGRKLQTIRKRAHCRPGDVLSLRTWSDKPYRSKQRIISTASCYSVLQVLIFRFGDGKISIRQHGVALTTDEQAALARADGFDSVVQMVDWFDMNHGLPFHGELIMWRPHRVSSVPSVANP